MRTTFPWFLSACLLLNTVVRSETVAATIEMRDIAISIPIADKGGKSWAMTGHICQPVGVDHPRLVVINHGSPPNPSDRPSMKPESCDSEVPVWFAQHRFASVFVLRLGYGGTGGPWTEGYEHCGADDYARAGLETARQIDTIVQAVNTLDGFSHHGVVVVGQSAGGWGTIAYGSAGHTDVTALINMSGGRGGHYRNRPNSNCEPDHLADAAKIFGQTNTTPMLWVYSKNDSFFDPSISQKMASAFLGAGGHSTFVLTDPFGRDGHHLFFGRGGSAVWGPLFERYLAATPAS